MKPPAFLGWVSTLSRHQSAQGLLKQGARSGGVVVNVQQQALRYKPGHLICSVCPLL